MVVVNDADREAVLRPLRDRIDVVDQQLVTLIAQRMGVVDEVVKIKHANGLPARLEGRLEDVVAQVRGRAEQLGAPPDLVEVLWRTMIDWVIDDEDRRLKPDRHE